MPRTGRVVVLLAAAILLPAGCTSGSAGGGGSGSDGRRSNRGLPVSTSMPSTGLTTVAEQDPVRASLAVSRALYARSGAVVVADAADREAQLLGASSSVALGVPLLLSDGGSPDALAAELDRLKATHVLALGSAGDRVAGGRTVVVTPVDPAAVKQATGVPLSAPRTVAGDDEVQAVAGLAPSAPAILRPEPRATPSARASVNAGSAPKPGDPTASPPAAMPSSPSSVPAPTQGASGTLPSVNRGRPLPDAVVLASAGPGTIAAVATARAAGAEVVSLGSSADPRTSDAAVDALHGKPEAVLAVGPGFAAEKDLEYELATATSGSQLPGGGQTVFPGRTLVALYGTPATPALGVLGEQGAEKAADVARLVASRYAPLVNTPVVPAFEIIATVASSAAGPDGDYSDEADPKALEAWVDLAQQRGLYVLLDLQPGRSDFLDQAKRYSSLLQRPNVGLALDPEWRLTPTQRPLQQIGSADVAEINRVADWLAELTRTNNLPQKLLVVHQFQLRMVRNRQALDTSHPELAVLIHADGQGTQPMKQDTWRALHTNVPAGPVFWGWKNFLDEDSPTLTPQQTIDQVHPTPNLITYQ